MDVMILPNSYTEKLRNMGKAVVYSDLKENVKAAILYDERGLCEKWKLPIETFVHEKFRGYPILAYEDIRRLGKQVPDGT